MNQHNPLSPVRTFACVLTFLITVATWGAAGSAIFYGAVHNADYPHNWNPYTSFGALALLPAVVFTIISVFTWWDAIDHSDKPRPR